MTISKQLVFSYQ